MFARNATLNKLGKNGFAQGKLMEDKIKNHVEIMLTEWAHWSICGMKNLGYGQSILGLLIENGGIIIKSSGPKYPPDNLIAEEMDKWINELKREKPREAQALVFYYLSGWIKNSIAKKFKISVRMLEIRIKTAKTWLEGRAASKKYI